MFIINVMKQFVRDKPCSPPWFKGDAGNPGGDGKVSPHLLSAVERCVRCWPSVNPHDRTAAMNWVHAGRLRLRFAVSQWEREAIGERTRDAMSHKRGNGERVGNIQFGYRLCADGKHLEPDTAEQDVLDQIRYLRQSGHTMRGIAAALNHRELRTRRGSAWRLEHVARIIKQEPR